jgi:tetratricopeptide (TPR) repeat protein
MKKILSPLLFFILTSNGFCQTIQDCIKYASEYRVKQDWPGLIRYCNKGLELKPNTYIFYWYRGTAKQQLADFRGALLDFDAAIRIKPGENPIVYYDRAVTKVSLKKYNESLPDFDMAIKLKLPAPELAYIGRGKIKILLGRKESGCLDLSKAGELGSVEAYGLIKKYCNF